MIRAVPLVRVEADWLTQVAVWSTFAAAVLALVAIIYSGKLSRRGQADLVRERRLDFELGLLASMSQQLATTTTQYQYVSGHVAALIRDPASTELPLLRVMTRVQVTDYCRARYDEVHRGDNPERPVWEAVGREVVDAISARVAGPSRARSPGRFRRG